MISLTVDAIVVALTENSILLVKRKNEPFKDRWAIPGGFVEEHEALDVACLRELREETGLRLDEVGYQALVAGTPQRDPRGRIVSIVYCTVISHERPVRGADDAAEAKWIPLDSLLDTRLAFDHRSVIAKVMKDVRTWTIPMVSA